MNYKFSRTRGLEDAKAFLSQALSRGKFPQALLIHGPEGVGQNPLLLDLADILACQASATAGGHATGPAMGAPQDSASNSGNRPCGKCAGCLGRKRNSLDSLIFLMPLEKKEKSGGAEGRGEGEMEGSQVDELAAKAKEFHDDPYGFSHGEKGRINIAQVRDMQARIAFAEVSQKARIVVILWAETMPHEAANALLKTLEEPPANTYFLLSSDERASLLPTILSRCTQLPVAPMTPAELLAIVKAEGPALGLEAPPARLLPFADGSLGALLRLHRNGGDTLVEEARRFWEAALSRDWQTFSDYLDASESLEDMESSARLLHFLLRTARLFLRLRVLQGPGPVTHGQTRSGSHGNPDGHVSQAEHAGHGSPATHAELSATDYPWTAQALRAQGLDADLAAYLGPLELAGDLAVWTNWIEEVLSAIQQYAKPRVAALGFYLEMELRETKLRETRGHPAHAGGALPQGMWPHGMRAHEVRP